MTRLFCRPQVVDGRRSQLCIDIPIEIARLDDLAIGTALRRLLPVYPTWLPLRLGSEVVRRAVTKLMPEDTVYMVYESYMTDGSIHPTEHYRLYQLTSESSWYGHYWKGIDDTGNPGDPETVTDRLFRWRYRLPEYLTERVL